MDFSQYSGTDSATAYSRLSIQALLDLSSVDFDNIEEVTHFAGNLISLGNAFGAINGASRLQSREAAVIYQTAKEWVNVMKARLEAMRPSDALMVIDSYEIMYRIANWTSRRPCEIDRVKLAAFDAMIRGDKRVDEYMMFRVIRRAISQSERVFFDRPLTWSCIKESQWYTEAKSGFDTTKLSDYDILCRTTILLESDLFAFEGNQQLDFKRQLFDITRHYLDNYEATDVKTHLTLGQYLYACAKFLTEEEFEGYRERIEGKCWITSSIA